MSDVSCNMFPILCRGLENSKHCKHRSRTNAFFLDELSLEKTDKSVQMLTIRILLEFFLSNCMMVDQYLQQYPTVSPTI